jgi:hypothetical protein
MKKIALLTLLLTIVNPVFAETYQMKVKISNILENSVFGSGAPSTPALERTGLNGSISLIGTNGLTVSSFSAATASSTLFPVASLFDGYRSSSVDDTPYSINDSATSLYGTQTFWSSPVNVISGATISADFGKAVNIEGIRLYSRGRSQARGVKDFTLQDSADGSTWDNVQTFTSIPLSDSGNLSLGSIISTQYLRILVISNQGDASYVQLDEIEIF